MYEDSSWYSFVPDITGKKPAAANPAQGHKRKESLLQQPNGTDTVTRQPPTIAEILEKDDSPPEPTVARRAGSFSDLRNLSITADNATRLTRRVRASCRPEQRNWDALDIPRAIRRDELAILPVLDSSTDQLLQESRREYSLYRDQLTLAENHLETLIQDANKSLALLTTLSTSFKSVEAQTKSFQARCNTLLSDQSRLEQLANEVGTSLYYYAYLDNVSRRLNAPGAGRLAEHHDLAEVFDHLESCIEFMTEHSTYRDAESYLARYQSLLTKALHLLEVGFSKHLETVSQDISRQLGSTQSESAMYALAYGRFEEMVLESYSLIPNVRKVVLKAYDEEGNPKSGTASDIYTNTANNIFHTYLTTRDRDLRLSAQREMESFEKEAKTPSLETACRTYTKQCFEGAYNEGNLFTKIFSIDPLPSTSTESAFHALRLGQRWLITPANLKPLATSIQGVLQPTELQKMCNYIGWLTHEYLISEYYEDESPFTAKCRQYTASLLSDYLWSFADARFEAETTTSITKAEAPAKSENIHPALKNAVGLLAMFDQSMPKERCQQDSPVVFKIVRETIHVLQRVESRIKSGKSPVDPDLFMIKNLLVLKNELVTLEIGDIRSQTAPMQHFSRIWETMSPGNWLGFFSNLVGAGSLWSRGTPAVTAKTLTVEDMSEQLDELLRQSIYAFTRRWAAQINEASSGKAGARSMSKVQQELGQKLQKVFSDQPEVSERLREAIDINAQALKDAEAEKKGIRRY
ncbi:hypothetical protein jhhlp_002991 [Lomentospora prolificans]|uniref:Conserved oligomeric Golgi complex subunit 3 n=1 Tax=Lomentospora prolificans TaxID=41688 RepID=A0A2N3NFK5_9PEZI|nr:hypothetical protein jhhlp_002991 [Lomentospora prolificans]